MSEIRKSPEKEISALAALNDSDIDTDAIPEVKDWTNARRGRFCRHIHKQVTILLDDDVPSSTGGTHTSIGSSYAAVVAAVDCTQMDSRQLIAELSMKNDIVAEEFVRRFQPLITGAVVRAARNWEKISPSLVDDLVQEVFIKILDSLSRILKDIRVGQDSEVPGIIRAIAVNVVNDNFRMRHAMSRGAGITQPMEIAEAPGRDASAETLERHVLFAEIEQLLKEKAGVSTRDLEIFLLYYREGLSAKKISQLPAFNLTVKGVESLLVRLTKLVRAELVRSQSK